jgi:predicted transcriptional regulator
VILISHQLYFTEGGDFRLRLKPLTKNQRSVLSLLNSGLLQASVAQRLNVSRPYINQITKNLESLGLIKKRKSTHFYDLSSEGKSLLSGRSTADEFTPARLHNFKKKYRIVSSTGEPYTHKEVRDSKTMTVSQVPDKRVHYNSSWKMRGPVRHKFWYPGNAGTPSVTVDFHIRTLVIYVDKHQNILARTVEEATALGWLAVQKARDAWVRDQHLFNVEFTVDEIGTPIGKPHAGFLMKQADPVIKEVMESDGDVGYADYWVDKSPENEVGKGFCEAETAQPENMTRLGRGIQTIEAIQPEMFAELEKIGPLTSEVHSVLAHIQGGLPIQNQVNQLIIMFGKMLEQQHVIIEKLSGAGVLPKTEEPGQTTLFS